MDHKNLRYFPSSFHPHVTWWSRFLESFPIESDTEASLVLRDVDSQCNVLKLCTECSTHLLLRSYCSSPVHKRASGSASGICSIPLRPVRMGAGFQCSFTGICCMCKMWASLWQHTAASAWGHASRGLSAVFSDASVNSFFMVEVNLETLVHTQVNSLLLFPRGCLNTGPDVCELTSEPNICLPWTHSWAFCEDLLLSALGNINPGLKELTTNSGEQKQMIMPAAGWILLLIFQYFPMF